jgi:hypothetical protein
VTRGLRTPPPDSIAKARDETGAQVNRIFLTLVGTAVFCALSLLTPDSSLLAGNEKISVPFAGPVSFLGFMLLGPAVLIILRMYLQIYGEHERRLDRIARRMSAAGAPTLAPDKNPLMRAFIQTRTSAGLFNHLLGKREQHRRSRPSALAALRPMRAARLRAKSSR